MRSNAATTMRAWTSTITLLALALGPPGCSLTETLDEVTVQEGSLASVSLLGSMSDHDQSLMIEVEDSTIASASLSGLFVSIQGRRPGTTEVRVDGQMLFALGPILFPLSGLTVEIPVRVTQRPPDPNDPNSDVDHDGVFDVDDNCPDAANADQADADEDDIGDACETDSDGDGTIDDEDDCPEDAAKTAPGECGCGQPDTDANGNGIADCNDTSTPDTVTLRVRVTIGGTPYAANVSVWATCPITGQADCQGATMSSGADLIFECPGLTEGETACVYALDAEISSGTREVPLDDPDGDGIVEFELNMLMP